MGSSELRAWQAAIEVVALVDEVTAGFPLEERETAATLRSLAAAIPRQIAGGYADGRRRALLRNLSLARTGLAELEVESILAYQLGLIAPYCDRALTVAFRALRRELAVLRAVAIAARSGEPRAQESDQPEL